MPPWDQVFPDGKSGCTVCLYGYIATLLKFGQMRLPYGKISIRNIVKTPWRATFVSRGYKKEGLKRVPDAFFRPLVPAIENLSVKSAVDFSLIFQKKWSPAIQPLPEWH
jgi:hypothetical protein